MSLRALARRLHRAHSNLVEYERGHRLAPIDVVEAYEAELGLASQTLAALHERVRLEIYGEDRSRCRTYVLKPAAHAPHQLPRDVADFTGREAELTKLRAIVTERADRAGAPVIISAIAGMAGVGKTTLAVHLAHELSPRFSDLQLYVNLHGYDSLQRLTPSQALDRFLRALGVASEALPTQMEEQASMYRGLLHGKRGMVVLDNASSADQVRPLLPGSPTFAVLATSRGNLGGLVAQEGAYLLRLDVLPRTEALELLSVIVGQDRVRAESQAAARLVTLCGCLPLAVRIAGARLATRPEMSIADLARRLAGKQQRLQELEVDDVGIRASFAFSYENLDPPVARMFRRLGLVAGPDFTPGVAAALTDTVAEEAEVLLGALVDAHLVEAAPASDRYRLHDLLRLYARERVQAEETDCDRDAALRRMLCWYLDMADAAGRLLIPGRRRLYQPAGEQPRAVFESRAQALAWFEEERANLVAATHQAADCGFLAIACQLPDAMSSFLQLIRHQAGWRDTHEVGLAAAQQANDRQSEAWMLVNLGVEYEELRQFDKAIAHYNQALAICREVGDRYGEGRALGNLSDTYRALSQFDKAIAHYNQTLAIWREVGHRHGEGWSLHDLGETYRRQGCLSEAINCLQRALAIHREVEDRRGEGWTLAYLGEVYRCLNRFAEAIDCLQRALAIHREVEDRWAEGLALDFLGLTLQQTQGTGPARACWREALRIFTEFGSPEAEEVRTRLETTPEEC